MQESDLEPGNRWVRALVAVAVVGALGGGGFAAYRRWGGATEAPIKYRTTPVDRGDLRATVTATGTLSALVTVQVGSQVSGRMAEVLVDFGSTVKKNQVIAKIDPQLLKAAVVRDQASLTVARGNQARSQASQTAAEVRLNRAQQLFDQGLGNRSDLDDAIATLAQAKADVQVSKGQVAQAAAALEQSNINVSYAVITSPVDGVVISRTIDVGQTVAASLQAPTLFTIAGDLRQMQVDSSVAEADVGKIKPAMSASFTVDAYPNKPFNGTVRQVRDAAVTVQNVVTYDAVIDIANPDLLLKPGMTANVKFTYAESDHALRIPNAALRFKLPTEAVGAVSASGGPPGSSSGGWRRARPDGSARGDRPERGERGEGGERPERGERRERGSRGGGDSAAGPKSVWVLRNNVPVQIRIRTGVTDGSFTEVVDGDLHEGDPVIVDAEVPDDGKSPTTKPTTQSPLGGPPAGGGRMGRGL